MGVVDDTILYIFRDDDKTLADYGLIADATLLLAPKMSSGIRDTRPQTTEIILIMPIPDIAMADLRKTIRGMHTSLPTYVLIYII